MGGHCKTARLLILTVCLYISICVFLHENLYLEMLHPGLTGPCLGLLLPSGLGLSAVLGTSLHCSRLACPSCTSPGVPNWRHHSVPWLRITVDSWGTSGVGGTSAPPCCCLLAATMLHTLQPEPPRSKITCTTDYSEKLWCCNCATSAVAAPDLLKTHRQ